MRDAGDCSQIEQVNSPGPPRRVQTAVLIAVIFLTMLATGTGGYLLGRRATPLIWNDAAGTLPNKPATTVVEPTGTKAPKWETYTDVVNGFSIQYPGDWNRLVLSNKLSVALTPDIPEPLGDVYDGLPGAIIDTLENEECVNAAVYAEEMQGGYLQGGTEIAVRPLNLPGLDGFITEGEPWQGGLRGPVAYIVRCTGVIRIKWNTAVANNDELVFAQILSSVKVWEPPKEGSH